MIEIITPFAVLTITNINNNILTVDSPNGVHINHFILLNDEVHYISAINGSDYTLLKTPDVVNVNDTLTVAWDFNDLATDINDQAKIEKINDYFYIFKEELSIKTLIADNKITVQFEDCHFKVQANGAFVLNLFERNRLNEPESNNRSTIILNGNGSAYRKDGYKYNEDAPVNDNGKLLLSGVDILQNQTVRSDFDFRELSTITLYNCLLQGPPGSYHHLDSTALRMFNFLCTNSTSLEVQRTPIEATKIKTIDNYFGISFYPQDSSIKNDVSFYDLEVINASVDIKRNSRSALNLIDTTIDPASFSSTGSIPLKFLYSTQDKIVDELGNPIPNVLTRYFTDNIAITRDTGPVANHNTRVVLLLYPEFTRISEGDLVYITDDLKGFKDGEYKIVSQTYSSGFFVSTDMEKSYLFENNPRVYLVQERTSDENGDLASVNLPYGYYSSGGADLTLYGTTTKYIDYQNVIYKFDVIPEYKSQDFIVLTNPPEITEPTNKDITNKLDGLENDNTEINNKLDSIQTGYENIIIQINNVRDQLALNGDQLIVIKPLVEKIKVDTTTIISEIGELSIDLTALNNSIVELNIDLGKIKAFLEDILDVKLDQIISMINENNKTNTEILTSIVDIDEQVSLNTELLYKFNDTLSRELNGIGSVLDDIKKDLRSLKNCKCNGGSSSGGGGGTSCTCDITGLEEKVNEIITKIDTYPQDFAEIKELINSLELNVEEETEEIGTQLDEIKALIISNGDEINNLSGDITDIKTEIEELKTGFEDLDVLDKETFYEGLEVLGDDILKETNTLIENNINEIIIPALEELEPDYDYIDEQFSLVFDYFNNLIDDNEEQDAALAAMDAKLDALLANLAAFSAQTQNKLNQLKTKINNLRTKMRNMINNLRKTINNKFKKFSQRIMKKLGNSQFFKIKNFIRRKFNWIWKKINNQFIDVNKELREIKEKICLLTDSARDTEILEAIDSVKAEIVELNNEVADTNTEITNLSNKVDSISYEQEQTQSRIDELKDLIAELDNTTIIQNAIDTLIDWFENNLLSVDPTPQEFMEDVLAKLNELLSGQNKLHIQIEELENKIEKLFNDLGDQNSNDLLVIITKVKANTQKQLNRAVKKIKKAILKLSEKIWSLWSPDGRLFEIWMNTKECKNNYEDLRRLIETQIAIHAFNYGHHPEYVHFPDPEAQNSESTNVSGNIGTGFDSEGLSIIIKIDTTTITETTLDGRHKYEFHSEVYEDYKQAWMEMMAAVNDRTYDSMNETEKEIASRWFCLNKAQRDLQHTEEEQLDNGVFYHQEMMKSKNRRVSMMMSLAYNTFSTNSAQLNSFISQVQSDPYPDDWTPLNGSSDEYVLKALDVLRSGKF